MPNRVTIEFVRQKFLVPSSFNAEDWDRVPLWLRERAFFMAGVDDAEILERFRMEVVTILLGERSMSEAKAGLHDYLLARGYQPEPGQEGTIKDLRTLRRMNVVLETNVEAARSYGQWTRQQGSLAVYPATRYKRGRASCIPRDWPARWQAALAADGEAGATAGASEEDMVALTNHPLWTNAKFNRLGSPWAPYDFGSGMMTVPVSGAEAQALGLLPDRGDESDAAMNLRSLVVSQLPVFFEGTEGEFRSALETSLDDYGRWIDGVLTRVQIV